MISGKIVKFLNLHRLLSSPSELVLVLILIVRAVQDYFFWKDGPALIKFYDTISYAQWGKRIFENPENFFNYERTPLYPIILHLFGYPDSPRYLSLYIFQAVLGLVSVCLIWLIARRLTHNAWLTAATLGFFTFSIDGFFLEKTALTEAVAVLLFLLAVYLYLILLKKPKIFISLLISLVLILSILNRPFSVFLFIPFALSIVLVGLYDQKRFRLYLLNAGIICLTTAIFIVGYSWVNYSRFSFPGISAVAARNVINNLLRYDMTPLRGANYNFIPSGDQQYPKLSEALTKCKNQTEKRDLGACLGYYDDLSPTKEEVRLLPAMLNSLAINYVLKDPFLYVASNMPNLVETVRDVYTSSCNETAKDSYCYGIKPDSPSNGYFTMLVNIAKFAHGLLTVWFFFVLPIFIFYGMWSHWRFSDVKSLSIILFILYHALMAAFIANTDFSRLFLPALPLAYLLMFITSYKLFSIFFGQVKDLRKLSRL